MKTTRLHRALLAAACATVLFTGASPAIADENMPQPLTKLTRGIVNLVLGLPEEIVCRVFGSAHSAEGIESVSSYVGGLVSGTLMGVGWGVARVGSGIVDVVTFPIPFDDNRPLLEPDYIL